MQTVILSNVSNVFIFIVEFPKRFVNHEYERKSKHLGKGIRRI